MVKMKSNCRLAKLSAKLQRRRVTVNMEPGGCWVERERKGGVI